MHSEYEGSMEYWRDIAISQEEVIARLEAELRRNKARKKKIAINEALVVCSKCKHKIYVVVAAAGRRVYITLNTLEMLKKLKKMGYTPKDTLPDEGIPKSDQFKRDLIDFSIPDYLPPDVGSEDQ